jgi:hypothetical protein
MPDQSAPEALSPGASVGEYRIESLLRSDPSSRTYRASQPALDRTVVVVHALATADSDEGNAFAGAARSLAAVTDPGLLPVYEVGIEDGRPFAVIADVRGERLDAILAEGPLRPERAVAIAGHVAGALDSLAAAGRAPADLGPDAIVVTADRAYLAPAIPGADPVAGASAAAALEELLRSMVDLPEGDRLARVIESSGHPSASALASAAREAVSPPRSRARVLALAAAGTLGAAAVAVALLARGEGEPSSGGTPASAPAGRIAARIVLNAAPGSVAVGDDTVWVATRQGTVLRVDPQRDEVAGAPIRFMRPDADANVTVRTGAGGVFVLDGAGGRVTRIDPATGRVTARRRLGGSLDGATVADGTVWVTRTDRRGLGTLVGLDAGTLRTESRLPGGWAGLAFDIEVAGGAAWVMSAGSGTVVRIDLATGERRALKPSAQPLGAAVLDGAIWVPDPFLATVTPLDVEDPQPPERVARAGHAFAVVTDGDALWVASTSTDSIDSPVELHRVDPERLAAVGRPVPVGRGAGWPAAGLGAVWVPDPARQRLLKVVPTSPPPAVSEPESGEPGALRSGPVPPGEWRTGEPGREMTLEVRDRGWVSLGDDAGLELVRYVAAEAASVGVVPVRQAFKGNGGIQRIRRAADVERALGSHPGLRVLERGRTTVGGRPALEIVVEIRGTRRRFERCSRPCAPLFALPQSTYVLEAPARLRVTSIDGDDGVLAVTEESRPRDDFTRTEAIVRTLRFG